MQIVALYNLLETVISLLTMAIFLRAILSWLAVPSNNPISEVLTRITEPVLAPLRRYIPRMGMMDLTPLIAIMLLQFLIKPLLRSLLGG